MSEDSCEREEKKSKFDESSKSDSNPDRSRHLQNELRRLFVTDVDEMFQGIGDDREEKF